MSLRFQVAKVVALLVVWAVPLVAFGDVDALDRQTVERYHQGKYPQCGRSACSVTSW